jgi:hypothetical protein
MDHGPLGILPDDAQWGDRHVVESRIGTSAFIVARDTWIRHCHAWTERYAADYDFIRAVLADHRRWIDDSPGQTVTGIASRCRQVR